MFPSSKIKKSFDDDDEDIKDMWEEKFRNSIRGSDLNIDEKFRNSLRKSDLNVDDDETKEDILPVNDDENDGYTDVVVMTIDNRAEPELKRNNPYALLIGYAQEAMVHSTAHDLTAHYYSDVGKCLNYPLIILSAGSSVMAGLDLHKYAVMGINLSMLTLTAFDHVINPRDKSHTHMLSKIEFEEVASNIKQYIGANSRTPQEIKEFSQDIYQYLTKWKSVAPSVPRRYMARAQRSCSSNYRPQHRNAMRPLFNVV